ncbi:hypothetical protein OG394_09730 [Kribbella sp. NBC_01245]|uniref:hypothetical protein n=1 Tax=Kribbella sp. NBC_01245 TaxID=2903578 RepID=UPI002E2DACB1|nr:hypothetical protein [Kribbella sp. NBC_01245]
MFDDLLRLSPDEILSVGDESCAIRDLADARFLAVVSAYAHHHTELDVPAGAAELVGCERLKVYGGEGCPGVGEFAVLELGCRFGLSPGAASDLVSEVLALQYRLPRTWARVMAGEAIPWRARRIARACMSLSQEAAAVVDAKVESLVNSLTPRRLMKIVKAAMMEADPALAKAAADLAARSRGVWVGQSDNSGTRTAAVRASTGDIARFDAVVQDVAETLGALGDTGSVDERRAKALGWLADPWAVIELRNERRRTNSPSNTPTNLTEAANSTEAAESADAAGSADCAGSGGCAEDRLAQRLADVKERARARDREAARVDRTSGGARGSGGAVGSGGVHTMYLFLSDVTLAAGEGVVRVEGFEPHLASQVRELLGHDKVVVKPVIDLRENVPVDAYEIPLRVRERVRLLNPVSPFPWSNAETTLRTDLDHIRPYVKGGPPGQTRVDNLGPLSRTPHRAKTHGGWRYRRLPDGAFEWVTRNGTVYRVDHNGTRRISTPRATHVLQTIRPARVRRRRRRATVEAVT